MHMTMEMRKELCMHVQNI